MVPGAYPPHVVRKEFNELCMAKDRPMELGKKTPVEHYYPAKLKKVIILHDKAVMALVAWEGYNEVTNPKDALQIVTWDDIKWGHELGRGKRMRQQTDAYRPDYPKTKPRRKQKVGGKMQEIIDLLDGEEEDDDEKSQAERQRKLNEVLKGMVAEDMN